ncbi:glycosyl hydrolase family 95 catalytic domain-containing protein [Paenibacillus paridis]|uniref:glycosyl hydrolase family 95 catalytic domain-containing protein n=1 Tax=Paenibacillus paridis TaxID=2583376 RepID=UPI0011220F4E|nr:glycoside hydrolase N-terminal domain-containing protein [Paenibacillus paridis]
MNRSRLWYSGPAESWKQGLPIGNGRIGAVIHGGIEQETWSMTEITYWSGKTERIQGIGGGKADLERMRESFFQGDFNEGDRLAKLALQPKKGNFGTNLSVCDVILRFDQPGEQLVRELSLEDALAQVSYQTAGGQMRRETFATHADGVVVSRISGSQAGSVSFALSVTGRTNSFTSAALDGDTVVFHGQATEDIHSDGTCGVFGEGRIKIVAKGGSVQGTADGIAVTHADEAVIYFAMNTDYGQVDSHWMTAADSQIKSAADKGYEILKQEHIADYRELYGRASIQLEDSGSDDIPTDERILRLRSGQHEDPGLIILFFQYGRYLTIAGTREDSPLPLHLQGLWNDGEANRMAWSCDYHLDINTQMNYYPTEIANLAECHVPLMNYIEHLSVAGKLAARDFYGCEGWVTHVFSNAWGFAAPGWETGWGLNVTGGLWIATHLKEHYEYGLDRSFLTQQAYPVLKEAAAFFLDYMTVHPSLGWLVTGPSNSPENSFYTGKPEEGAQQLSMGSTLDQQLVRDLFTFCLEAAELLQTDLELQKKLKHAIALLPPLMVGKRGQLQEWLEDYEEAQPEHRHLSHTYALYPSSQITPLATPELSAAVKQTLLGRMQTDELEDIEFTAVLFATGFSRLYEGDRALKHITHLIGELCFDNLLTYSKAGVAGAETNIFVIDGNYGGTAAVADLLLQSSTEEINLLPALPSAWPAGSFQGLRAKGNAEVDVRWEKGAMVEATIRAFSEGNTIVRSGDQAVAITLSPGHVYTLDQQLNVVQGQVEARS